MDARMKEKTIEHEQFELPFNQHQEKRGAVDVRNPVRLPSPDQAKGCVNCIQCLAWPKIQHSKGSKWGYWPASWSVYCVQCNRNPITAGTRSEAVKEWNKRNQRH